MDQNPQQTQTPTIPTPPSQPSVPSGSSTDTHTIITILLLIFVYPVGVIVMWFITKWPIWVKILLTCFLIVAIAIFGLLAAVIVAAINPAAQLQKAQEANQKMHQVELENKKAINDILSATPEMTQPE